MDALLERAPQEPDAECDRSELEVGRKSVVDRSLHRTAGHVTMWHTRTGLCVTVRVGQAFGTAVLTQAMGS